MKSEDLYLRIKGRTRSRKYRDERPFNNYLQKVKRSEKLLNLIGKRIQDKGSRKEALVQFVISDITAFEVYFRDLFQALYENCDDQRVFLMKCEKLIDKKFNFHDLIILRNDNIDLSDIILEFQNFQNLDTIIKVFSIVLKEDFLDEINKKKFRFCAIDNPEVFYEVALNDDWYSKINEYLSLRHNLTHDFNPKLKIDHDDIFDLHRNIVYFVITVDMIFLKKVYDIDYCQRM